MATIVAQVRLWGEDVGALADVDGRLLFEYEPRYLRTGRSISPIMLPLEKRVFEFPALRTIAAFSGLPGVFADSLPDKFGSRIVEAHFAAKGFDLAKLSPVQKLLYIGRRGMGALEFEPAEGRRRSRATMVPLEVAELVQQARRVVSGEITESVVEVMRASASAGGMRAKALIGWNRKTREIVSGLGVLPSGYESWLIKFDGANHATASEDYGRLEYAYSRMARAAGIEMSETVLLEEGGRAHFLTRRFDRDSAGNKIHMHTLCGLRHADFNAPGVIDYDLYFNTVLQLQLGAEAIREAYRRMVFNVVAKNQDDHSKNFAFLLLPDGAWRLAPAYDITYANGANWTKAHQMRVDGQVDNITWHNLENVARRWGVSKPRQIIEQVVDAVAMWPTIAHEIGIAPTFAAQVASSHRLDLRFPKMPQKSVETDNEPAPPLVP